MTNRQGEFVWYELMTRDVDGAMAFYGALLGWTYGDSQQPDIDYRTIRAGNEDIGGILALSPDMLAGGAQPAWLGYVAVDDIDASLASLRSLGGTVHMGPRDLPATGRLAMVADPQGVPFYLMQDQSGQT